MYEFIKGNPEFPYNKDIPRSGCLCEIYENSAHIAKAVVSVYKDMSINPHNLVEFYSCYSSNQSCMEDNCSSCSVLIKLDMEDGNASIFLDFQWTKEK